MTDLPKAPSLIPPGCFRNEDGSLSWWGDQGYYNAMCDGWDPTDEIEWYDGFSRIGVGEENALVLVTVGYCDREPVVAGTDPWEGLF